MEVLAQFWTTAEPSVSGPGGTIFVDLIHAHPEYLYRSLVVGRLVQMLTGGRLVGLIGAPRVVTMFLEVDPTFSRRLAGAFGVREFVDLPSEGRDLPSDAAANQLIRIAESGTNGEPLSRDSLERLQRVVDTTDGFPIGRTVQDVYMRSELDARVRHGERLSYWCREVVALDAWIRSLIREVAQPTVFVTGHLDYQWGHLASHLVRAGGRAVCYRVDDRLPINLIDSIPEGGTLNGSVRQGDAEAFADFERTLAGDMALSENFVGAAQRLSSAVRGGVSRHFRAVAHNEGNDPAGFGRSQPTFIAFAHTFTDQPVADVGLFPDHFGWLDSTLSRAAESGRFNLLVKAHPQDESYDRSGAFDSLRRRYSDSSNIRFTRDSIAIASLLHSYDAGITVRGSPGLEMTAAGLPMILAGRGPHSDSGFCLAPETREEYFHLLEEGLPVSFDIDRQSERARLFQAFDRFWSAPVSTLLRPYLPLPRDDAWSRRIAETVRGVDLMTDTLFLSLARAWPGRNAKVISISLQAALEGLS